MSKYTELQDAFSEWAANGQDYRKRCAVFLQKAVNAYLAFLEAPPESLSWIPADEEPEPGARYAVTKALLFLSEGFIGAKASLDLEGYAISFTITVRPMAQVYQVKFVNFEDVLTIQGDDPASLRPVSEWLWKRMNDVFRIRSFDQMGAEESTVGFELGRPDG